MKQIEYKNITIESVQALYKTNYITEIIFDADSKIMNINEDEYLILEEVLNKVAKSVQLIAEAIYEMGKRIYNACKSIIPNLDIILNKKITKKKFMKLLQSSGIQRNAINAIVKNNKEPYTYARYYQILKNTKE